MLRHFALCFYHCTNHREVMTYYDRGIKIRTFEGFKDIFLKFSLKLF
jgi:hypothetical protein